MRFPRFKIGDRVRHPQSSVPGYVMVINRPNALYIVTESSTGRGKFWSYGMMADLALLPDAKGDDMTGYIGKLLPKAPLVIGDRVLTPHGLGQVAVVYSCLNWDIVDVLCIDGLTRRYDTKAVAIDRLEDCLPQTHKVGGRWADPVTSGDTPCTCDMMVLMRSGCGCGSVTKYKGGLLCN